MLDFETLYVDYNQYYCRCPWTWSNCSYRSRTKFSNIRIEYYEKCTFIHSLKFIITLQIHMTQAYSSNKNNQFTLVQRFIEIKKECQLVFLQFTYFTNEDLYTSLFLVQHTVTFSVLSNYSWSKPNTKHNDCALLTMSWLFSFVTLLSLLWKSKVVHPINVSIDICRNFFGKVHVRSRILFQLQVLHAVASAILSKVM